MDIEEYVNEPVNERRNISANRKNSRSGKNFPNGCFNFLFNFRFAKLLMRPLTLYITYSLKVVDYKLQQNQIKNH